MINLFLSIAEREVTVYSVNNDVVYNKIICTNCSLEKRPIYKRIEKWLTIFLIPICSLVIGPTYAVCSKCYNFLSMENLSKCNTCHAIKPAVDNFCRRCGYS
ncbi:hypothetical protein TCON_1782 [Astathelohania contejeani]|uniref:Zinc-ribbon 15 domain-containing protein n=1 Tax=Astathelohania contejeani TaxID=164912 RepID=A0ABQ7HXW6_9MICR|nr:hypothetical protein TCON_1782 [Thelohania contejeani]